VSHGLRPSLRCALVLVATVAAAIIAMVTTAVAAMQEVALRGWGNAMAMCDGDKARMCAANNTGPQPLNSSPICGLHCEGE